MWGRIMVAEELCAHLAKALVDDHEQDVLWRILPPRARATLRSEWRDPTLSSRARHGLVSGFLS